MRETRFASIGKAVLVRMVGLQENYKDGPQVDWKKSGCFSCPHFREALKGGCTECGACDKKTYSSSYVNEANRYGFQPSLSLCGMKVFLYLHFCSVTQGGVVSDIHVPTMAGRLGISQRNIHNCLDKLEEAGYITYGRNHEGPGHYTAILSSYQDYFKKANEGGRGYLVLSMECFNELVRCGSINQMRLYIRLYLNIDGRKNLPFSHDTFLTDTKQAGDLARYFPAYLKKGAVKKLLDMENHLFEFQQDGDTIRYSLGQEYYGEQGKADCKSDCLASLEDYITATDLHLSEVIKEGGSIISLPPELIKQAIQARGSGKALFVGMESGDLDDLASIAVQYGYDDTIQAIHQLWASNPLASLPGHYGEYARVILESGLCAA